MLITLPTESNNDKTEDGCFTPSFSFGRGEGKEGGRGASGNLVLSLVRMVMTGCTKKERRRDSISVIAFCLCVPVV